MVMITTRIRIEIILATVLRISDKVTMIKKKIIIIVSTALTLKIRYRNNICK